MNGEVIATYVAGSKAAPLDPSFFDVITHSGPVAFVTLLVLVGFSVASWAIILVKWLSLRQAQKQSALFLETFWQSKRLDDIFARTDSLAQSPIAQVFRQGYQELLKVKKREKQDQQSFLDGAENVERALRRAATAEHTELTRLVPFLATVGSTSPFIGLFGTVVGIMRAMADISEGLGTVGPAISEALIATAAGLLAAIPAVIAFNTFNNRIRVLEAEMENFASDFMNIVRRHFF